MVHSDAIRNFFFLKLEHLRTFWNQGRCMVHSDAIWNNVLGVGIAFKSKDAKWCILPLLETIFRKLEHLRTFWNLGRCMLHSDSIWNDVLEIGNGKKVLKARTQNGAFWRYLKQFLGSWNCWENFESKEKNGAFRCFAKNVDDNFQGSYWMLKYVHH